MTTVYHGEDIAFDLYPKTDPKNGPRIRRLTSLQKGSKIRREQKGTGLVRIVIPGDSDDAEAIDPTLGYYIKAELKGAVVQLALSAAADDVVDTAAAHGLAVGDKLEFVALTGGTGLSTTPVYYVQAVPSSTSLKVAATKGGAAINFTTDITAGSIRKLTTKAGGFLLGGTYAALSKDGTKPLVLTGPGPLHILSRAVMAPHSYIGDDPQPEGVWPLHKQGAWFGDDHYGSMFARAMTEMKATQADDPGDDPDSPSPNDNDRLEDPIPEVTLTFDGFTDSNGVAWTGARGEFDVQVALEDGLRIAFRFMQAGLEIDLDPDTFELRAYNTGTLGTDRTGAAWGAGVVRYQVPTDDTIETGNVLTTAIRSISAFIQRSLLWAGRDNVWGVARNASSPVRWEGGYSSDAADETSLNTIAGQQIIERTDAGDVPRIKVWAGSDESKGQYEYGPGGHADIWDRATVHSGTGTWDWNDWTAPISALEWVIENPNGEWDTYVEFGSSFRSINEVMQFAGGAIGVHSHPPNPRLCVPGVLAIDTEVGPWTWDAGDEVIPALPNVGQPAHTTGTGIGLVVSPEGQAWSTNVTPRTIPATTQFVAGEASDTDSIRFDFRATSRGSTGTTFELYVDWFSGSYNGSSGAWTSLRTDTLVNAASVGYADYSAGPFTPPTGTTAFRLSGININIERLSWTFVGSGVAAPNDGHIDLVGTGSRATRCDHRHDIHRDTAPTVNDDWAKGYKVGTRWAQLDSLSAPTAIVAVWILADATEGAAVWIEEPLHSTHAAEDVDFTPAGTIAATDVQAAIAEVATDAATDLAAHTGDTTNAHDASAIGYDNSTSGLTATDVKAAIDEVAAAGGGPSALDDLTDVDTTSTPPVATDVLAFDGTNWVPSSPSAPGAHAASHEDGGADEVEIANLPTSETDTALVLHPDGAGGVAWGTDAAGAGGTSYPFTPMDEPPASPHANDEEMDGALDAAWAWVAGSGTPTSQSVDPWALGNPAAPSYNVNSDIPGNLVMQPVAGSFIKAYRAYAPSSGTEWAVVAKVRAAHTNNNEDGVGIQVTTEVTPGTTNYWPPNGVLVEYYRSADAASTFRGNGGSASVRVNGVSAGKVLYLAITSDTSNAIRAWYSDDGIGWTLLTTYTGLTINGAVATVVLYARDTTGAPPTVGMFEWVRFLTTDNLWACGGG